MDRTFVVYPLALASTKGFFGDKGEFAYNTFVYVGDTPSNRKQLSIFDTNNEKQHKLIDVEETNFETVIHENIGLMFTETSVSAFNFNGKCVHLFDSEFPLSSASVYKGKIALCVGGTVQTFRLTPSFEISDKKKFNLRADLCQLTRKGMYLWNRWNELMLMTDEKIKVGLKYFPLTASVHDCKCVGKQICVSEELVVVATNYNEINVYDANELHLLYSKKEDVSIKGLSIVNDEIIYLLDGGDVCTLKNNKSGRIYMPALVQAGRYYDSDVQWPNGSKYSFPNEDPGTPTIEVRGLSGGYLITDYECLKLN